jgi:predicted nucleotidyltransferase
MNISDLHLRPNQLAFVNRLVEVCQSDDRVVAAFIGGSYAKGYSDSSSDVDVCVITTDPSFEDFCKEREDFLRAFGNLVFLESFGNPDSSFFIYADDTEGELNFASESRLHQIHSGTFKTLVDKKNILAEAVFPPFEPPSSGQAEKLRGLISVFWHELSHFNTAMQRDQLWWARGQLEALRSVSVNLARLNYNFLDPEIGEEAYFKIETMMPVEQLFALRETFCPMEKEAMLKAGVTIVHFYQELAPSLADQHGIAYPKGLERVMMDRLKKLQQST